MVREFCKITIKYQFYASNLQENIVTKCALDFQVSKKKKVDFFLDESYKCYFCALLLLKISLCKSILLTLIDSQITPKEANIDNLEGCSAYRI